MVVLSLFDGMSGAQVGLNKAGVKYERYYASEIDKYAQVVSMANYPDTVYLGDVRGIDVSKLEKIDLLVGGSPCQSFSFAGKRNGMSTKSDVDVLTLGHYLRLKADNFEFDGQSYLFWEYMRILEDIRKVNPGVKFLLENVMMGKKWEGVLTRAVGMSPIVINSALVSAQSRKRNYWTNIYAEAEGLFGDLRCMIPQPKDKGILLKDILESEVDSKYFISDTMISRISRTNNGERCFTNADKALCLAAGYHKQGRDNQYIVASRGRNPENPKSRKSCSNTEQQLEPRFDGKTNTLTSVQKDNLVMEKSPCLHGFAHGTNGQFNNQLSNGGMIRRLTPLECERLQCVPDGFTAHVSDSQRYKMLGNGFTCAVIAHIFSFINK